MDTIEHTYTTGITENSEFCTKSSIVSDYYNNIEALNIGLGGVELSIRMLYVDTYEGSHDAGDIPRTPIIIENYRMHHSWHSLGVWHSPA